MKYLFIIFKRIVSCICRRKMLAALYAVSYILIVMIFLFIYNNFSPIATYIGKNEDVNRYYEFEVEASDNNISEVMSALEKYSPEYIVFSHYSDEFVISSYYQDRIMNDTVGGRIDISGNDGTKIVVPERTEKFGYRPDTVTIENQVMTVVGWNASNKACTVSVEGYIQNKYTTNHIEVFLTNVLPRGKSNSLLNEISSAYQVMSCRIPEQMYEKSITDNKIVLLCITVGFMNIMIIFGLLAGYIVKTEVTDNNIMRLVGATRADLIAINFGEQFVINLILSVVAAVLHFALFNSILEPLNYYRDISMGPGDYMMIIMLTTIGAFCITAPYIARLLIKNPLNRRKAYL